MHLFYMDDSTEGHNYGFCAVGIPEEKWLETFAAIKDIRRRLKKAEGIYTSKELHATDFVAGRGHISDRVIHKGRRCQIFRGLLKYLADLDGLVLLSVLMNHQETAYERLLNRINATMRALNSRALIVSDKGRENDYTRLARRMSVHNPIPSRYGSWPDGKPIRNIPTQLIVEDPFFRDSRDSYLLQMADFCAFALLRYVLGVPEHKKIYGLHTAFELLEPICRKQANTKHPLGIIGQFQK